MNEPMSPDETNPEIEISKSQRKREADALQVLGERLLTLTNKQLKEVDLPEVLADAVMLAKSIKSRGGLKRQLQYIGKLMRNYDAEAIDAYFLQLDNQVHEANSFFHKLEKWRDRIIEEGDDILEDIMQEFPAIDLQHLRQLVRNAKNIKNEKMSIKAKRELFQYLKQLKS